MVFVDGPVIVNTWAYGKESNEQALQAVVLANAHWASVDWQRRGKQRVERASDHRAGRAPRGLAAEAVAAAQETALTGPAFIVPAKQARFTAAGLASVPREQRRFPPSRPTTSLVVPGGMPRVAWRRNERVVVTASGYLAQARTTTAIGPVR